MPIPAGYTSAQIVQAVPVPSGIIQVQSTFKSDTFSTASTSFVDVTGLSVSITPTSASNKILVMVTANLSSDGTGFAVFARLMRDSTAIAIGDTAGSRTSGTFGAYPYGGFIAPCGMEFLDSPATTSATTYKLQVLVNAAGTGYLNRTQVDSNAVSSLRTASTITVMEVKP
jgi:hypothetical protein